MEILNMRTVFHLEHLICSEYIKYDEIRKKNLKNLFEVRNDGDSDFETHFHELAVIPEIEKK